MLCCDDSCKGICVVGFRSSLEFEAAGLPRVLEQVWQNAATSVDEPVANLKIRETCVSRHH